MLQDKRCGCLPGIIISSQDISKASFSFHLLFFSRSAFSCAIIRLFQKTSSFRSSKLPDTKTDTKLPSCNIWKQKNLLNNGQRYHFQCQVQNLTIWVDSPETQCSGSMRQDYHTSPCVQGLSNVNVKVIIRSNKYLAIFILPSFCHNLK